MTKHTDVHSVRARNIRAHLRKYRAEFLLIADVWDYKGLQRFITSEQFMEWHATAKRIEKIRREQQDAQFAAHEAGFTDLDHLLRDGYNLAQSLVRLEQDRKKITTFKSTNASRIRVFENKAAIIRKNLALKEAGLRVRVGMLTDHEWEFLDRDEQFDWLLRWKKDQDFAPMPTEILNAEAIALLDRWIAEWDAKIEEYESLKNPTIK